MKLVTTIVALFLTVSAFATGGEQLRVENLLSEKADAITDMQANLTFEGIMVIDMNCNVLLDKTWLPDEHNMIKREERVLINNSVFMMESMGSKIYLYNSSDQIVF